MARQWRDSGGKWARKVFASLTFRSLPGRSRTLQGNPNPTLLKVTGLHRLAASPASVTVIFVHYHHRGLVTDGFKQLIHSSVEAGFRSLLVSSKISEQAIQELSDLNLAIAVRANYGYDFGSIREARELLMKHGLLESGRYVFINSSMLNVASHGFGQDAFLDALANQNSSYDLLGVTGSFEDRSYHIQTYFFSASSKLFESKAFGRFLGDYIRGLKATKESPRLYAIKNGELKLTKFAISQGMSVGTLLFNGGLPPIEDYELMKGLSENLAKYLHVDFIGQRTKLHSLIDDFSSEWMPSAGLQFNPSQSCWALLLAKGFLFLKREALELSDSRSIHAPSICAMITPVMHQLAISPPAWSDLNTLPEILFAPKVKPGS
jgi:hypothetical protein